MINNIGTKTWNEGEKYEGMWKDGIFHGRGSRSYTNGDFYDGDWNQHWPDGGQGIWHIEGKYDFSGLWEYTLTSGAILKYSFINGQLHG